MGILIDPATNYVNVEVAGIPFGVEFWKSYMVDSYVPTTGSTRLEFTLRSVGTEYVFNGYFYLPDQRPRSLPYIMVGLMVHMAQVGRLRNYADIPELYCIKPDCPRHVELWQDFKAADRFCRFAALGDVWQTSAELHLIKLGMWRQWEPLGGDTW